MQGFPAAAESAQCSADIHGFLYPMMRHDVTFSGYRTTQGYIDFWGYKSDWRRKPESAGILQSRGFGGHTVLFQKSVLVE